MPGAALNAYPNYDGLVKFDLSSAGIAVANGDLLRFRLTLRLK